MWGGVGGGGGRYCADYVLEHPIDIRQYVVVPTSQHAITVRFDILRALFIGRRFVLASINLDDNASRVTDKIGDVAADANLAAEMCAGYRDAMAQVPPELALKRFQYFSSSTVSGFQCVGGSGLITRFSMPGMRVLADQD